jgi:hypothetical protein
MAIGPAPQILLGCSNSGTDSVIINENDGKLVAELSGQSGSNQVWYNPGDNQYFLASVVDTNRNGGAGILDLPAHSARGSHSVAADPV